MDQNDLIQRYLEDELSPEEFAALSAWIQADPANADQFMRFVADDRVIEKVLESRDLGDLIAEFTAQDGGDAPIPFDRLYELEAQAHPDPIDLTEEVVQRERDLQRSRLSRKRSQPDVDRRRVVVIPKAAAWSGFAAAVVLLAVIAWPDRKPSTSVVVDDPAPAPQPSEVIVPPAPLAVATLLDQAGAVWVGEQAPALQQALMPGVYELAEGLVRLRFDSEAVTIIEAPAVFSLDSQAQLTLMRGKVAAVCQTPRSKGFVVQTPDARITDLGTAFSVEHWAGERTLTQVMEGEVELRTAAASATDTPVKLTLGQAAVIADQSSVVQRVPFEAYRASTDWSRLVRRPKLEGEIRYAMAAPPSVRVGEFEDEREIVLLLERVNTRLERDLIVSFTEPGRYGEVLASMRQTIHAGQTVDSYLLHMDVLGDADTPVRHAATITFDRPVLGVIVHGNRITASDDALGHPDTQYAADLKSDVTRDARGLDVNDDLVVLSADRRTLIVQLQASTSMDQVRVLVAPRVNDSP